MKNFFKLGVFATAALSCLAFSKGATVSILTGSPITEFKTSDGNVITTSSPYLIQVGFFTNYGSPTFATDLAGSGFKSVLASNFVPIGDGSAGHGASTNWALSLTSGKYTLNQSLNSSSLLFADPTASFPANSNTTSGVVRGTQLFVIVYNATTVNAATEVGIYGASDAAWTVPTNTSTSMTMLLAQVNSTGEVYRGNFASGSLTLAAVPEPSGVGLLLVGSCLLYRRKRI